MITFELHSSSKSAVQIIIFIKFVGFCSEPKRTETEGTIVK